MFEFDFKNLVSKKNAVTVAQAQDIVAKAQQGVSTAQSREKECRNVLNIEIVEAQLSGESVPAKVREAMARAQADLVFANANLEAARAIHQKAVDTDEQAQHAAKIKLVEGHLSDREKDAAALAAAIEKAVAAYRSMLLNTEKAEAVGLPLPMGSMVGSGPLSRATEYELYRLGHDVNQKRSFPGGTSPSIMMSGQPLAIKPLLDELRQANAFAIAALKAQRD
jgi:hypothetical protein